MKKRVSKLLALGAAVMLALAGCGSQDDRTEIVVQRFFGECGAVYGQMTDVSQAEGECGILTALINKFEAENPDIRLKINVVAWPGYPQLTAQVAARDGEHWASWGPAGLSMGHRTREDAEQVQIDAHLAQPQPTATQSTAPATTTAAQPAPRRSSTGPA